MKRQSIRVFTAVLACFAAAYLAYTVFVPVTDISKDPAAYSTESYSYYLRDCEGKIALFAANSETPLEVYDILTSSLPAQDSARLLGGIGAASREQLQALLEDYTS